MIRIKYGLSVKKFVRQNLEYCSKMKSWLNEECTADFILVIDFL